MKHITKILSSQVSLLLGGVPEGFDALLLSNLAREAARDAGGDASGEAGEAAGPTPLLHICRDDTRLRSLAGALAFFAGDIEVLKFPAWDCLPYDRVSPNPVVVAARMGTLAELAGLETAGPTLEKAGGETAGEPRPRPRILLSTVNALLQRLPARDLVRENFFEARVGQDLDREALIDFLTREGYLRSGQVSEPGEFAVRGGLIDIFPTAEADPVRLDLFGDRLDAIRVFDALSQLSTGQRQHLRLLPANEFIFDQAGIDRFRKAYHANFGANTDDDPLYGAVSAGRRHQGMEHWLPLFHDHMETLFDYLPQPLVTMDFDAGAAIKARFELIRDYFEARTEARQMKTGLGEVYKPLAPERLYLTEDELEGHLANCRLRQFSPLKAPPSPGVLEMPARPGRDFAPERQSRSENIYEVLKSHTEALQGAGKRVILAAYSLGARERLRGVLEDHGMEARLLEDWAAVKTLEAPAIGLVVLALERGFETGNLAFLTETDLLGDRLIQKSRASRRAGNFLKEASSLGAGDLVVHVNHGIGRFDGLETLQISGAPHDCLRLIYRGGDRLYLPVENIEMLTRFGAESDAVSLDRLGGSQWQARHAKIKKRIREMAEALMRVAAQRQIRTAEILTPPEGIYEEFAARFPYTETEDQMRAIRDVIGDLASGRPMDRLICGDVGFGKTEVALRAAFITALHGLQVAIVAPTTLLSLQHFQTFRERFAGLPVRIEQLSRLVGQKKSREVKEGLENGQVDIVIGTHALLAKNITFRALSLIVVDEEQHFGVAHKERLKALKSNAHVLTMTATPIPRTLQMAMSGLRDLSIIATPPVDRLAIRTFVMPFDEMIVREALLREHYRGGQSFFVCPRVADIGHLAKFLAEHVPEVKYVVAHGQLPVQEMEGAMTAFYQGRYDVLISTSIIESGLDIPAVNTIIIHRADMFGLAQLYQIRGRVGRSKVRAYAYLTIPPNRRLPEAATKRLQVLQSLDTLGAGFTLASHDLDIRGAGNLLGQEQSGHIREVGIELYQQMLEKAVAGARDGDGAGEADRDWSPQLNLGATILIPGHYVADVNLRMALYRRLGDLKTGQEVEAFAAELIDRFGPLPEEVEQLLSVVHLKADCIRAGIEKMEAGPKGILVNFRENRFANPAGLVAFISSQGKNAKLRPDHTLVYMARGDNPAERIREAGRLARDLARVAGLEAAE